MRYRYRSDDELKDSGVEWLGKIPKDWEVKRNRHIIDFRRREVNEYEDTTVLSLTINGVKVKKDLNFGKSTESYIGHQLVYPGDIVFTPRDFDQTPILSGVSDYYGCISNLYFVLKCKSDINNYFVDYFWWGLKYKIDFFKNFSYGIRYGYNYDQFKDLLFLKPNYIEQEKIANFLDEKTSQFDLIISKKEKLIERLEEAKKSLISEVVTGKFKVVKTDDGYELVKRSSEEMKDSGVEWLGQIPNDWEVKYFKHMFNFKKGLSITKADLKESGIPCVNYGEIHSKYRFELNPSKQNLKYVDEEYLTTGTSSLLEYGDFIFCDTSEDLNGCGNFTYLNEYSKVFAGYHTIIARGNKEINYRYIAYLFESDDWRYQIRSKVSGIKVFSITQSILKTTTVIQPSLIEQKDISDYLDIKCNGIKDAINKTKLQIEKLKEAKQSLISEAVTGKIEILD